MANLFWVKWLSREGKVSFLSLDIPKFAMIQKEELEDLIDQLHPMDEDHDLGDVVLDPVPQARPSTEGGSSSSNAPRKRLR